MLATYTSLLEQEFQKRLKRNHKYSLRAFARDMGVPSSNLSNLLKNRRGLSVGTAEKIATNLRFDDRTAQLFLSLVAAKNSRSELARKKARQDLLALETKESFTPLELDRFEIINKWYHLAILELVQLKAFQDSTSWIANRLGILPQDAGEAVSRLIRSGMLVREAGKLKRAKDYVATPCGTPSKVIRDYHRQILQKAGAAMETTPIDKRSNSATNMTIDTAKLPEAIKALREFRRKFCKEQSGSKNKDRVYCLAIHFFPLDEVKEEP